MDVSKEYIDMCRRAVEIQELWEPKSGDFTYLADIQSVNIFAYGQKKECSEIWLPRQDQLQGVVDWESRGENGTYYQTYALKNWSSDQIYSMRYSNSDEAFNDKYDSLEKVWLAFVMDEKYGKKWEDGEWATKK